MKEVSSVSRYDIDKDLFENIEKIIAYIKSIDFKFILFIFIYYL